MSMGKIEQKIVELAHMFVQSYGEKALQMKTTEFEKYIIPNLTYNEKIIFNHNKFKLLVLFYKTVVTDLRNMKR